MRKRPRRNRKQKIFARLSISYPQKDDLAVAKLYPRATISTNQITIKNHQNRQLFSFPISILPLLFSRKIRVRDKHASTNDYEKQSERKARVGVSKVDRLLD